MYTERYLTCINGNLLRTVNFILVVYIDLVHILNLLKLIFGRLLCESHNNSYSTVLIVCGTEYNYIVTMLNLYHFVMSMLLIYIYNVATLDHRNDHLMYTPVCICVYRPYLFFVFALSSFVVNKAYTYELYNLHAVDELLIFVYSLSPGADPVGQSGHGPHLKFKGRAPPLHRQVDNVHSVIFRAEKK